MSAEGVLAPLGSDKKNYSHCLDFHNFVSQLDFIKCIKGLI